MRRHVIAAVLIALASGGCKSVEVAVDYPGMHVAAKFEAHDRRRIATCDVPAQPKGAEALPDARASDPRPSMTITL